eukprot:4018632-Alexandrium_andersonii.AAC.1
MSASLVGSEMCIRDRPVRPSVYPSICPSVYPSIRLSVYPSICLSVYPVSYTHLTLPTICSV